MNAAVLLVALGVGCGASRRGPVDPPPAWRSDEGRMEARLDIARALVKSGNPEASLSMVSQLRTEGIKGTEVDLVQASALREMGLTDDAEELLADLVRRHPRVAGAHDQLGVLCLDTQRVDEAVSHLQRAAELAPDDADILNNLGFALMTAGRPDEAVSVLRDALRVQGANRQVRNNLGFALVAAGRDAEALRVFRAGLPEADARYNLGLGLEMRGDSAKAIDEYALILDKWPGHEPARTGLRRLHPSELHLISAPKNSDPSTTAPTASPLLEEP